jgi:hypothetical protein
MLHVGEFLNGNLPQTERVRFQTAMTAARAKKVIESIWPPQAGLLLLSKRDTQKIIDDFIAQSFLRHCT